MFGEFMGGGRGRRRGPRAGADVRAAVEIDLVEAFAGVKKPIRVPTRVACEACNGTGSESKEKTAETCTACGGAGKVRAQQGFFIVERTCPTCGGAGQVVRNPCRICSGAGTVQRERSLQVNIPAGIEDGTNIRLTGEGEAGGPGGQPGDLFVHVGVRPHEIFQREGANILCHVPIRMTQAALGADVEVPSIDGSKARVKIPPGTQTGAQFRLRGKGFSVLRSHQRGDMFIQITVETPQHLTPRQRELLEQFESDAQGHHKGSPQTAGFFAKMRDFFDSHGRAS
jgi:molecular chaperone DnaJ